MNLTKTFKAAQDGLELEYDDTENLVFWEQTSGNRHELLAQVRLEKHDLAFLAEFLQSVLKEMEK